MGYWYEFPSESLKKSTPAKPRILNPDLPITINHAWSASDKFSYAVLSSSSAKTSFARSIFSTSERVESLVISAPFRSNNSLKAIASGDTVFFEGSLEYLLGVIVPVESIELAKFCISALVNAVKARCPFSNSFCF